MALTFFFVLSCLLSGTVDECNSAIGLATAHLGIVKSETDRHSLSEELQKLLDRLQLVQQYLFDLGAHLATPKSTSSESKLMRTQFSDDLVTQLESWIDDMDAKLPRLTTFVLPGGHPAAAALHMARTIARRAERVLTPLIRDEPDDISPAAYHFLNRLSDFFFVASRFVNHNMGSKDHLWDPKNRKLNTP